MSNTSSKLRTLGIWSCEIWNLRGALSSNLHRGGLPGDAGPGWWCWFLPEKCGDLVLGDVTNCVSAWICGWLEIRFILAELSWLLLQMKYYEPAKRGERLSQWVPIGCPNSYVRNKARRNWWNDFWTIEDSLCFNNQSNPAQLAQFLKQTNLLQPTRWKDVCKKWIHLVSIFDIFLCLFLNYQNQMHRNVPRGGLHRRLLAGIRQDEGMVHLQSLSKVTIPGSTSGSFLFNILK